MQSCKIWMFFSSVISIEKSFRSHLKNKLLRTIGILGLIRKSSLLLFPLSYTGIQKISLSSLLSHQEKSMVWFPNLDSISKGTLVFSARTKVFGISQDEFLYLFFHYLFYRDPGKGKSNRQRSNSIKLKVNTYSETLFTATPKGHSQT